MKKKLNEKLGVPDTLLTASETVFDTLYKEFFQQLTPIVLRKSISGTNPRTLQIGLDVELQPTLVLNNNIKLENIDFFLEVIEVNPADIDTEKGFSKTQDLMLTGMRTLGAKDSIGSLDKGYAELEASDDVKDFYLGFNLISTKNLLSLTKKDFTDFLDRERARLVASIGHELKHVFDYSKKTTPVMSLVKYSSQTASARTSVTELRKLFFSLYKTDAIELTVYNTEFASLIRNSKISKDEFESFIKKSDIWKNLTEAENVNYRDIVQEISQIIDDIALDLSKSQTSIKTILNRLLMFGSAGTTEIKPENLNALAYAIKRFGELDEFSEYSNKGIVEAVKAFAKLFESKKPNKKILVPLIISGHLGVFVDKIEEDYANAVDGIAREVIQSFTTTGEVANLMQNIKDTETSFAKRLKRYYKVDSLASSISTLQKLIKRTNEKAKKAKRRIAKLYAYDELFVEK